MNIFVKIKNYLKYAYHDALKDWAFVEMRKHEKDENDREWRKWAKIAIDNLKKCIDIPLK